MLWSSDCVAYQDYEMERVVQPVLQPQTAATPVLESWLPTLIL